jgi:hypothetical protein
MNLHIFLFNNFNVIYLFIDFEVLFSNMNKFEAKSTKLDTTTPITTTITTTSDGHSNELEVLSDINEDTSSCDIEFNYTCKIYSYVKFWKQHLNKHDCYKVNDFLLSLLNRLYRQIVCICVYICIC